MENKELLTAPEAAEFLSVSEPTVWRASAAGQIPKPIRIRGARRWRRSALQQWLDEQTEAAA